MVSSSSSRSLSAHPGATAFGLGVVLLAIMAAGISSLFLFTHTAFVLAWAIIAVIISGVGLIFLVLGNIKRVSLINEISTDAEENAEYLENHRDVNTQRAFFDTMAEYKEALREVGALAQASQISDLIVKKGGQPPPGVERDYSNVRGPVPKDPGGPSPSGSKEQLNWPKTQLLVRVFEIGRGLSSSRQLLSR